MSSFVHDLRLAFRLLKKRPVFAATVVGTLALGIGANTAIFSVVNGVLLSPLPYSDPNGLAMIWSKWTNFEKTWVSSWELFQYRQENRLFRDVAVWGDAGNVTLTADGVPESVASAEISSNLFSVLGVAPARGRTIAPAEDLPNGPRVVMVSYDLWQRRYGGDPALVDRTVQIDGLSWTVIGILPKTFRLPLQFQARTPADLFFPVRLDPAKVDDSHSYYAVMRLAAGVTVEQVSRDLGALTTRWITEAAGRYPETMRFGAFAVGLQDEVSGGVRRPLWVLTASVGLLLLIACANIANLLLVRADGRSREVAVRAALGAGRRDLLRLALIESLVLAAIGGTVGVALAGLGVNRLAAWAPTTVPRVAEIGLDASVLGFAVLLSLITGLGFAAAPGLQAARVNLASSLKEGGRTGTEGAGRRRARHGLVTAEMAVAVILVIGAGLTFRSFRELARIDPGFDPENALTLQISLPPADYPTTEDLVRFYQDLGDNVRQLPGVRSAGWVRVLPIAAEIGDAGMEIEGRPMPPGEPNRSADWQVVTPGYFEAMGIRLVAGRFIDLTDTPDGLPVIAINQTLAREYFPGEDPVGKRIRVGGSERPWRTIIGVVGDTRHNGLTNAVKRAWFIPHSQFANAFGATRRAMTLVARTTGEPRALLPAIKRLISERDKNLPITEIATLDEVMGGAVKGQRFTATLMAGLAVLTLVLAAVGIYGVISYSVTQRTQEIGVRIALGADHAAVRRMVVRQGMGPVALGIGIGLVAAAWLSHSLRAILYGVEPVDPVTFVAIPVLLALVAIAAAAGPARRATRIDPAVALRGD